MMYLHRLTMNSIGPFRDTVDLDLARLSSTGLFLLRGPTGSGKSTIIDAITFALFGKVAGATTSDARIVSRMAVERPNVELTFEVSAGIFRVLRTPSHERAKLRGAGMRIEPATVKLWRLASPTDSEGDLLSNAVGEADGLIHEFVGMSRAQFAQTVALPQGEFARFLHAKPDERSDVLRQLFATEIYEKVTELLAEGRKKAEAERRAADGRRSDALTALSTAAELTDVAAEQLRSSAPAKLRDQVKAVLEQLRAAAAASEQLRAAADEDHHTADAALTDGEATARDQRRWRQAFTDQARLRSEEPAHLARVEQIQSLQQLQQLEPTYRGLVEARSSLERETDIRRDRVAVLPHDLSDAPAEIWQSKLDECRAEIIRLGESEKAEDKLASEREQHARCQSRHDKLVARCEQQRGELGRLESTVADLERRRDELIPIAVTLERATSACATAIAIKDAALSAQQQEAKLARLGQDLQQVAEQVDQANEQVGSARQRYISGIAGTLASQLEPGAGCPVCGSEQHPAPHPSSDDAVTSVQLEKLEQQAADLAAREKAARLQYEAGKATLDTLRIDAHGSTVEQAEQNVTRAGADRDRARRAADDLQAAEAQGRIDREHQTRLQAALNQAQADIAALAERIQNLINAIQRLTESLAADRAGHDSVGARIKRLRRLSDHLAQAVAADRAELSARADMSKRQEQFRQLLAEAGVDSEGQFREGVGECNRLATLRQQVEQHNAAKLAVGQVLSDDALRESATQPEPDLEALRLTKRDAAANRDEAVRRENAARNRHRQADKRADLVISALDEQARTHRRSEAVIRIAEVAAGTSAENLRRIPLATYVLLDRFGSVVAAANERLSAMSDGRYSLVHQTDEEDGRRKSGLGLRICDHIMDCERDPKTLSGGETFYVSLALALGLADVVTAEAGGVQLGTLFIDEGFGSLDPETLDSVLTEVGRLRQAGRVVGIVSHVEELKQRIPDQVEVVPIGGGVSTIRVVA